MRLIGVLSLALAGLALLGIPASARAYAVLSFFGAGAKDGREPYSAVIFGPGGDLYGTTANGGAVIKSGACEIGCGTIFRLHLSGARTTIHNFGGADGALPVGPLLAATDGRLYGTASQGDGRALGGTLFSLKPDGSDYRIVHFFDGNGGAGNPQGGLIAPGDGYLYGTTVGGKVGPPYPAFAFRVRPDGSAFAVLHTFYINNHSGAPTSNLLAASDGRLYGTTGISTGNVGLTIFGMDRDGSNFSVLHIVPGRSIFYESPALIEAVRGHLYGVQVADYSHGGALLSLALNGSGFSVLHRFSSGGEDPMGTLVLGRDRQLYGTTFSGSGFAVSGTIFALHLDGSDFRTLHAFGGSPHDGASPTAGLTVAPDGSLLGTTRSGGINACPPFAGCGTVFRSSP